MMCKVIVCSATLKKCSFPFSLGAAAQHGAVFVPVAAAAANKVATIAPFCTY